MTTTEFHSVEDVYAAARQVRDALLERGEKEAAAELDGTMRTFWTTASEALGEMKLSLLKVRPTVERATGEAILSLLDAAVVGATKLFEGA